MTVERPPRTLASSSCATGTDDRPAWRARDMSTGSPGPRCGADAGGSLRRPSSCGGETRACIVLLLQPRLIEHADIGFKFRVALGGPAVAGRPPGLAGVPGGGVDPAGRSVGLPSATPVPYTALTGGP